MNPFRPSVQGRRERVKVLTVVPWFEQRADSLRSCVQPSDPCSSRLRVLLTRPNGRPRSAIGRRRRSSSAMRAMRAKVATGATRKMGLM
jgi:hypothetical protein